MPLPPLVEPGPPLTPEQVARYSRHLLLPGIGATGQRRLANARVLVVGAGGLGSPVLLYLAAAGVGTIGIVDQDVVEESNLQRQVVHTVGDLGRSKVTSAAESVRAANPLVTVVEHELRLTPSTVLDVVAGYDLVLDGTDNFPTRYLVNDACVLSGLPLVWGSVLRFHGQVSVFWAAPPEGSGFEGVHYRDVFPTPPAPGEAPSCAEAGVLGVVCASVGAMMATEAIKLLTGVGEPLLGRLLVLDALESRWREVRVRPDPAGVAVTALADDAAEAACATGLAAGAQGAHDTADTVGTTGLSPRALADRLAARDRGEDDFELIDVREPGEHELVAIPGSRLVPRAQLLDDPEFGAFDPARPLVFYCKGGTRSADVLARARARGLTRSEHLDGGILAWIDEIDPALPRY